ncbi:MAG: flagellar hook-associated protein FlgL [Pseudomonadales bacterium]|nr:flagellar hook-associated protein FlgL [Pseudomonadales bacterium]
MRISSAQINQQGIARMLEISQEVAKTQSQMATGKRINKPGDDPVGAARVIRIKQELETRAQYQRNIDAADAQLAQEDTVLQQTTDVLQRIRELALVASNGVQSAEDRRFVAIEIEARFEELMSLVNTRGPTGEYLFSGFKGDVRPFVLESGNLVFRGDEGQRRLQVDSGQYVTVNNSGREVFMDIETASPVFVARAHPHNDALAAASISAGRVSDAEQIAAFYPDDLIIEFRPLSEDPTGAANFTVRRVSDNRVVEGFQNIRYQPGTEISVAGMSFRMNGQPQVGDRFVVETTSKRDVLSTVKQLTDGLKSMDPSTDPVEFQRLLDDGLTGIDNAMNRILEVRSQLGARMNTIDSARALHESLNLEGQRVLSDIQDLDFAEAASRLSFQSFLLEAAQQSFVRISGLSLFNALR